MTSVFPVPVLLLVIIRLGSFVNNSLRTFCGFLKPLRIQLYLKSFNQLWLGYTCMCCCEEYWWKLSRRKLNNDVLALLGKVDINWFAIDVSICLHLSEWHICIFCPITIVVSMLVFTKSVRKRMLRWQGKKWNGKFLIITSATLNSRNSPLPLFTRTQASMHMYQIPYTW